MDPLAIHPGAAHLLLQIMLIGWAAIEVVLRLRNMGGRTTFDWTLCLVIAAVAAGVNLGFRAAHVHSAVLGGGWASVTAGLVVLAAGVALRTWPRATPARAVISEHFARDHSPARAAAQSAAFKGGHMHASMRSPQGDIPDRSTCVRFPIYEHRHLTRSMRKARYRVVSAPLVRASLSTSSSEVTTRSAPAAASRSASSAREMPIAAMPPAFAAWTPEDASSITIA
jgi:hypothetical protein